MAETAVRRCMFLLWFLCGQPHKETNQPILGRVLYRSHRPAFETEYWRNRPQGRERHRPFLRACSAEAQDLASSSKSHFRSAQGNYRRSIDLADVSWLLQALIRLVTRKRDKTILIPIAGPLQNHILSLPTSDDPKSPIHPEDDGWFLVRTRGSHRQYKHAQKPGLVTIAGKPSDDLAPGTKNSILKQAGLK
jgi:predicted RNA binding protein YcfA (HicA-like mRNA interferase family)